MYINKFSVSVRSQLKGILLAWLLANLPPWVAAYLFFSPWLFRFDSSLRVTTLGWLLAALSGLILVAESTVANLLQSLALYCVGVAMTESETMTAWRSTSFTAARMCN